MQSPPGESASDMNNDTPSNNQALPSLKLKIGAPPALVPETDSSRVFSLRRSERLRNQALKAEEARRIKEERAAIEEARAKARSVAAKKAAATKRKAQQQALQQSSDAATASPAKMAKTAKTDGANPVAIMPKAAASVKKPQRRIVKLHYSNPAVPPSFTQVDLAGRNTSVSLFWLRANIREFLLRFDKLCRLPARFITTLNDPLESWTPEQFKPVIMALLRLIANDPKPLHAKVRDYIAEIEVLDAGSPRIWDWLLEFVEQIDAFAPEGVPTTEEEQLDLLRRLVVICTGTETIRVTVMSDVDQLKWVEKDANDDIKGIWAKYKENEQKLAKFKSTDKELYAEKVAAAHRSATNKAWKAQQHLYMKMHKYNMRTVPLVEDPHGNKYWSLQYKSPTQPAWGAWILCEMLVPPLELAAWYQKLSSDVTTVLRKRDEMVAEKNEERRKHRKDDKSQSKTPNKEEIKEESHDQNSTTNTAQGNMQDEEPLVTEGFNNELPQLATPLEEKKPKRRYPKLKIDYPTGQQRPQLYFVEGRENIVQLAQWVQGFPGVDKKAAAEIESVGTYLGEDI